MGFYRGLLRPAKKTFSDGTNVHVTVRPLSWWRAKLEGPFEGKALLVLREASIGGSSVTK